MNWRALVLPSVAAVTVLSAACDDDPTRPDVAFSLACPTGTLPVNSPITLDFTEPVLASTVTGGNIVVTDVETGIEVPGSLVMAPGDGDIVQFVPSDPLPFQTELRLRVQNLLTASGNAAIDVTVCELLTADPPITQLWWERIPTATGNRLLGASQYDADQGFVASNGGPIFERDIGDFIVAFHDPHFNAALDVSALAVDRFFSVHTDIRANAWHLLEHADTVGLRLSTTRALTRVIARDLPASDDDFLVLGGGTAIQASFFKWEPGTETFTEEVEANTGNVLDIDFGASLDDGAAATGGAQLPGQTTFGRVYFTADSGRSWAELASDDPLGSRSSDTTLFYRGVAEEADGTIWAVGGNAAVIRFEPTGTPGTYTRTSIVVDASLTSLDPSDPRNLAFNDIQFSLDDPQLGWLIGQQLVGVVGGVPQFHGLIYETTDGGATWTRQGVIGAPDFGASFPALNRLDVFSSTAVWIVGDGGIVLRYSPQP